MTRRKTLRPNVPVAPTRPEKKLELTPAQRARLQAFGLRFRKAMEMNERIRKLH